MKHKLILTTLLLLSPGFLFAQTTPYKVVFDLTSSDTVVHKMVIRWVNEIIKANPEANIETVLYAKSLELVTDKSIAAEEVKRLSAMKNVSFKVCEVAMQNNKIERIQLLPGVGTVPDGIYEIISKQSEGWGYIKAAR